MSSSPVFDIRWQSWLESNLNRGCNPEDLLRIMLVKHRFDPALIRSAMGPAFPSDSALMQSVREEALCRQKAPQIDHVALSMVRLTRHSERVVSDRLQLYVLDDFLEERECDDLVQLIDSRLRPSTVTRSSGDPEFRTSSTCDLSLLTDDRVAALDEKISLALGVSAAFGEGNQGQRYDVGQQFKPHTDYFQPGTDEFDTYARTRGNRTWTFMVFLNDTPRGGGTRFVNIDRVFYPRKGRALAWNNLYPDGSVNPGTLHCGEPVEEGCKIIVTKWYREFPQAGSQHRES